MKIQLQASDLGLFKQKILYWLNQNFDPQAPICYLDNNQHHSLLDSNPKGYECIVGVGAAQNIELLEHAPDNLGKLQEFAKANQGQWILGSLSYDLKNDIENLSSQNEDQIQWALAHFFVPQTLILLYKDSSIEIQSQVAEPTSIYEAIQKTVPFVYAESEDQSIHLSPKVPKQNYLNTVDRIREHIIAGDLYEMNYCQEFYTKNAPTSLNPFQLFERLNQTTQTPFASFYHWQQRFLLCGSPERFIKKTGQKLLAQPIKGTIKRGKTTIEDQALQKQLYESIKDRAENVMIVDLMRNDLTRICETGTIEVPELFGIYPFAQVSQMISTVTGQLKADLDWVDVIKHTFPMGSMTGAPKIMSMQLIEKYEASRRGLYSGSVGYITPDGDFDFNVIIRSLLYNSIHNYLSLMVGGAIVYDSIPELEYEECLTKIKGLLEVLQSEVKTT
ncbi:MAG: anthranilate synthase component I family protein [Saprospiraceae bacterium]|nr:anthranilate synthase component I family protein [Saprospiraceae bacterium]